MKAHLKRETWFNCEQLYDYILQPTISFGLVLNDIRNGLYTMSVRKKFSGSLHENIDSLGHWKYACDGGHCMLCPYMVSCTAFKIPQYA